MNIDDVQHDEHCFLVYDGQWARIIAIRDDLITLERRYQTSGIFANALNSARMFIENDVNANYDAPEIVERIRVKISYKEEING